MGSNYIAFFSAIWNTSLSFFSRRKSSPQRIYRHSTILLRKLQEKSVSPSFFGSMQQKESTNEWSFQGLFTIPQTDSNVQSWIFRNNTCIQSRFSRIFGILCPVSCTIQAYDCTASFWGQICMGRIAGKGNVFSRAPFFQLREFTPPKWPPQS